MNHVRSWDCLGSKKKRHEFLPALHFLGDYMILPHKRNLGSYAAGSNHRAVLKIYSAKTLQGQRGDWVKR